MRYDEAAAEKVFAAEKGVAMIRALVIYFNIAVYLFLMERAGTIPWLAYTIVVVAGIYGVAVLVVQPWRRYPVFRSSVFTSATDASLITLWVAATGGFASPFYLLWYLSLIAIAFRYDQRTTLVVSVVYAGLYLALLLVLGHIAQQPTDLLVRIGYIFLIAALGGLVARETAHQTRGKVEMRQLAEMTQAVTGAPRMEQALEHVVDTAMALTQSDRGAVYLLDAAAPGLRCAFAKGLSSNYVKARVAAYETLPGYGVLFGESHVHIIDARSEPRLAAIRDQIRQEGFRTYAVIPLIREGKHIGVLSLYRDAVRPFAVEELAVARTLANHAVIAIENAQLLLDLRESEERFRAVAETANDAIITFDEDGRVTYVNPAGERLFGHRLQEVRDRPLRTFFPEEVATGLEQMLLPGRQGQPDRGFVGRTVELRGLRKGGDEVPVEMSLATALGAEGVFYAAIVRDLTERKRAEEDRLEAMEQVKELERLKELDDFKTQFINTAAHELGTPLTPIRLQLHILKDPRKGNLSPNQVRSVEMLERNVERLITLVQDVLEGARLQANRLGIVKEPMDLNRVVMECVESFHPEADAKGVTLETRLRPDLVVEADAKRLTQVMFNLLSNALKFTPRHGRITVTTDTLDGQALVRVADTGIGMRKENISRLFRPFIQVHDTLRHTTGGTGLGLYISKGIVELHGGRIMAESKGTDRGSVFSFTIPFETPGGPLAAPADAGKASVSARVKDLV